MLFTNQLDDALNVLRQKGCILLATDSFWAIAADATSKIACKKIFEIKNRAVKKDITILIDNENQLPMYSNQKNLRVFDYLKDTQKPLTVIYQNAVNLAPNLTTKTKTVAIQITNDEFCKQLIKKLGRPLAITTACKYNTTEPQNFEEISDEIKNGVDHIVQHRLEEILANKGSVIKWLEDGSLQLLN